MRKSRSRGGLVSIGYGGRRPSDLLQLLLQEGVHVLVDVRLSPRTRIPGFSGSALANALRAAGIEYRHEPQLGNPVENQEPLRSGSSAARSTFQRLLESEGRGALHALTIEAASHRVAVLCAERDSNRCHRQVIVESVTGLNPAVAVTTLA